MESSPLDFLYRLSFFFETELVALVRLCAGMLPCVDTAASRGRTPIVSATRAESFISLSVDVAV